jgi:hypothetical protein
MLVYPITAIDLFGYVARSASGITTPIPSCTAFRIPNDPTGPYAGG